MHFTLKNSFERIHKLSIKCGKFLCIVIAVKNVSFCPGLAQVEIRSSCSVQEDPRPGSHRSSSTQDRSARGGPWFLTVMKAERVQALPKSAERPYHAQHFRNT